MKRLSVKLLIILFVLALFSSTSLAEINITKDTTWNEAGSPYVFNDDVIVADGVTLEISPGTVVKFANGKGLYVKGHLRINPELCSSRGGRSTVT